MNTAILVGAVCEVAGFAAAAMMVGLIVKSYVSLPERIAVHFGLRGEANGWGPRGIALALPVLGVIMFVALTAINPALGISTRAVGPDAKTGLMIATVALTGNIVLLAAVERGMISFNLGETRSLLSPPFAIALVIAVLAIALAIYLATGTGR